MGGFVNSLVRPCGDWSVRTVLLLSAGISGFGAAAQVHAQSVQSAVSEQQVPGKVEEAQAGLQEIVVTAQKRAENLQEVPIAIAVISGDELAAANINSARDLVSAVPGLIYSQAGGTTQTFLRGIGTTITVVNADPSVATYIDGVYQSMSMVSSVKLSSIRSVEVLKGPQGTLYGRNSTGGAISINTLTPTDRLQAFASAGIGNYSRREFGAYLSGPIARHLYFGVYGDYEARDQFSKLENANGVPRPAVRDYDFQWAARSKLVYDNDDNFRVVLSADVAKAGSLQDMAWQQLQPDAAGYGSNTIGPRATPNLRKHSFSTNVPVDNNWRSTGGSLRLEYETGKIKLVSISAYRDSRAFLRSDGDATEATIAVSDVSLENRSRQTTQEVQLLSNGSGPLKWVLGGFYYNDKGKVFLRFTPPTLSQTISSGANTTSYSAYAQVDWSIAPAWSLTVGGRYTSETKDYTGTTIVNSTNPAAPTTTTFAPKSTHYSKFNPKVGVQYHFDDGMLYASYSQAFKSGVYNLTGTSAIVIGPVNPERLDAYEVGVKTELLDRTLRLNTSFFHYKFRDVQVQTFAGGSLTLVLLNAAKAHFNGIDVDAVWAASSRLQFSVKMLLMTGKYDSFPAYPAFASRNATTGSTAGGNVIVAGGVNLTGKTTARTPSFSGTFGAKYTLPLADSSQLVFNGSVYHTASYSFVPDGFLQSAPYTTVDGSIEYTSSDGRWSASVWAKNLNNAFYYNYKQINTSGYYGIAAAPRTFGATVSFKLGD